MNLLKRIAILWALLLACTSVYSQQPAADPAADALLKRMSSTLSAARSFTFESHSIADDFDETGQKLQRARNQKIAVRRPDRFAASVVGDIDDFQCVYDGKEVTLVNQRSNLYASTPAKDSIDETLDMLASQHGLAMPLADLLVADPYKSLTERVRSTRDLGVGYVLDDKCRHLAFRQEFIDWQIWISESDNLPRKIVITYKEQPGHPQYTAFLKNWNLSAESSDSAFVLTPPPQAKKTAFAPPLPATQPSPNEK